VVTLRRRERELARANLALDAANFFLADVRDALGPYLAVYLLTEREWDAASIGLVMSIATIAGILAQTPSGALVDATKAKRGVMVAASVLVTAASLVVPWLSSFWPVAVSQATAHAAGVVFGPATARRSAGGARTEYRRRRSANRGQNAGTNLRLKLRQATSRIARLHDAQKCAGTASTRRRPVANSTQSSVKARPGWRALAARVLG
jgi:MFS_1 like family